MEGQAARSVADSEPHESNAEGAKRLLRLHVVLSLFLVLTGAFLHFFLLRFLDPNANGSFSPTTTILIRGVQGTLLLIGLLVYFKGGTSEGRKWLLFSFLTVALMVVVSEVCLRLVNSAGHFWPDQETQVLLSYTRLSPYKDKDWAQTVFEEYFEQTLPYEPFVVWKSTEYVGEYTNIDAQGHRHTWNAEADAGEEREAIYLFGGSTMWGMGSRDNHTIPSCLSREMHAAGLDCRALNCGVLGYTSGQQLAQLMLLLRDGHRPDYVVFYDGFNDTWSSSKYGTAGLLHASVEDMRAKLDDRTPSRINRIVGDSTHLAAISAQKMILYRSITQLLSRLTKPDVPDYCAGYSREELDHLAEATVDCYLKNVSLLEQLSKTYGFKYACFWQPVSMTETNVTEEEAEVVPRLRSVKQREFFNLTRSKFRSRLSPNCYDISNVLSGRETTHYIDIAHLSEEGNRVVASEIFKVLSDRWFSQPLAQRN